ELKRTGLKSIEGQLYVDDYLYEQNRYSEGRQDTRVDRAYDAPIGALSFNWNSVNVYVRPGEGVPNLFADPENDYVQVVNKAKMGGKTNLSVERKTQGGKDVISVHGTMAPKDSEQVVYKSVTQPEYWAGSNFKSFLNQQGISYSGDVKKKKTPITAEVLVSFKSKPLREIIADMNKFSNNYVAEMLTIAMAEDRPATLNKGLEKIHKWLLKMGWVSKNFVFVNPAGFSNQNQIRPQDLGELLVRLQKKFASSPEFLASLPISGVDGTLKRRLQDMKLRVRAKTGLLNGKIGLAGYAEKEDKIYTFVFIFNGPTSQEAEAKTLFDNLLRKL
ncbi:MAG: D-alanyl-D-alanine carboxypeptidase/D-alanyl-D-alanine-endopeptidase, partial [Bdellovibrionales bacterium]|nr:D-alanyl-D-alanine carboxypeptidase/D-alanyl-D-alanine-endopeptidase [Bdellovibrionales bacterium]